VNTLNKKLNLLNDNKFFAGIIMIFLNIGSKYISLNFSKNQEGYIKNALGRQILIFSMSWIGSRDILISLILTAVFTVLADHVLNENSSLCILPKKWRHLYASMDLNNDGEITEDEVEKAIKLLEKAKSDTISKNKQLAFNNFFYNL
tara:strand:- start:3124 stop:3564 length:441 start_codon:yes stop_codon:yes gene_type:complete